ncbi:hypothetical protein ATK30_4875 [Amycolatopsis echigonensis]|uniref:Uncharacterized protein n=1 Tax=Amycolatopsis echigonensis TaxID=2576905 RepID=A0A2N3WJG8_9PSEU|nr:hypothetical protein ATK30_4875 [Amycolatopsis niigatensis]
MRADVRKPGRQVDPGPVICRKLPDHSNANLLETGRNSSLDFTVPLSHWRLSQGVRLIMSVRICFDCLNNPVADGPFVATEVNRRQLLKNCRQLRPSPRTCSDQYDRQIPADRRAYVYQQTRRRTCIVGQHGDERNAPTEYLAQRPAERPWRQIRPANRAESGLPKQVLDSVNLDTRGCGEKHPITGLARRLHRVSLGWSPCRPCDDHLRTQPSPVTWWRYRCPSLPSFWTISATPRHMATQTGRVGRI